jgi:hypothetical protein
MRLSTIVTVSLLAGPLAFAGAEKERKVRFAREDAGKLPASWKAEKTGQGEGSVWQVVEDATGPGKTGYVLAQTAPGPNALFNICVLDDSQFDDGEIRVSFKAVRGQKDQGEGIVWRYQDRDNYYIARLNPLERNLRVYKVVAGKRTQLQSKEDVKVRAGEWHEVKIKTQGDRIDASWTASSCSMSRTSSFRTQARSACGRRPTPRLILTRSVSRHADTLGFRPAPVRFCGSLRTRTC